MIFEYVVLLAFLLVVFVLTFLIPFISATIVYQENYQEKVSPYECGFEPFEHSLGQFEIRYYLLAILFLIFDLEIVYLLP
jgi:NADH-quinone oxidoreductase subunit A